MLNVVQIQKLSKEPRTAASCFTWFRSMVASNSLKKVLPSCASSTVRPVFSVTQFDRDGAVAAVIAKRILQPRTSWQVTSSKTADSLDTRMLQATPHHPPHSSQPVPPADPFGDSPLSNRFIREIAITQRDKQLFADLRRASAGAIPRCIAWVESLQGAIGGHESWAMLCRYRCRLLLAGGRYKVARSAMREQWRSKTAIASLPNVKLARMSAPGPTGERQEHLDAIISFAGAGQRRRLFRGLDILTMKLAIGDLPEECRFLLITQLMFLKKKKKDPTSKQFDDDEWIQIVDGSARNHRRRPGRQCHV